MWSLILNCGVLGIFHKLELNPVWLHRTRSSRSCRHWYPPNEMHPTGTVHGYGWTGIVLYPTRLACQGSSCNRRSCLAYTVSNIQPLAVFSGNNNWGMNHDIVRIQNSTKASVKRGLYRDSINLPSYSPLYLVYRYQRPLHTTPYQNTTKKEVANQPKKERKETPEPRIQNPYVRNKRKKTISNGCNKNSSNVYKREGG